MVFARKEFCLALLILTEEVGYKMVKALSHFLSKRPLKMNIPNECFNEIQTYDLSL